MFPAVYRLIDLTLLLPVAMTIVEGAFLATKIIKIELHKKISIMAARISTQFLCRPLGAPKIIYSLMDIHIRLYLI
jgi:hypothetical protein